MEHLQQKKEENILEPVDAFSEVNSSPPPHSTFCHSCFSMIESENRIEYNRSFLLIPKLGTYAVAALKTTQKKINNTVQLIISLADM